MQAFFCYVGCCLFSPSQWKWRHGLFWTSIVNSPDCNIVVFQTCGQKSHSGSN